MATGSPKHVIASCILACLRQFSSLLIRLTENAVDVPDTLVQKLHDEFQTFRIWCEIWGPFQPGEKPIDVRLQFFDFMRTSVAMALVDLHRVIVDTANPTFVQDRVYLHKVLKSFSTYDPDKVSVESHEPHEKHLANRQASNTDEDETTLAIASICYHTDRLYALSSKFNAIAACPINTECSNFLDFDENLSKIRGKLDDKTHRVALVGPTGIGKTTLAVRFAQTMASRDQILILWIDASCYARIKQSYDMIGFPNDEGKEHSSLTSVKEIFEAIFSNLRNQKTKWLMILDGVRFSIARKSGDTEKSMTIDSDTLIDCLPPKEPNGMILITSVQSNSIKWKVVDPNNKIYINPPQTARAIELFDLTMGSTSHHDQECKACLVSLLGHRPGAITQLASLLADDGSDHPVREYIRRTLENLTRRGKLAMDILCVFSFFGQPALHTECLEEYVQSSGAADSQDADADCRREWNRGLEALADNGLITMEKVSAGSMVSVHPYLRNAVLHWLEDHHAIEASRDMFIRIIYDRSHGSKFPESKVHTNERKSTPLQVSMWEYIRSALAYEPQDSATKLKWAWLMCLGSFDVEGGSNFVETQLEMAERSKRINIEMLGRCHLHTMVVVERAIHWYGILRQRDEARKLFATFLLPWMESAEQELDVLKFARDMRDVVLPILVSCEGSKSESNETSANEPPWDTNQREAVYRSLFKACDKILGVEHEGREATVVELSNVVRELNEYKNVEQIIRRRLPTHENLGLSRKTGRVQLYLGEVLLHQHKCRGAADMIRQALDTLRQTSDLQPVDDIIPLLERIKARVQIGDWVDDPELLQSDWWNVQGRINHPNGYSLHERLTFQGLTKKEAQNLHSLLANAIDDLSAGGYEWENLGAYKPEFREQLWRSFIKRGVKRIY